MSVEVLRKVLKIRTEAEFQTFIDNLAPRCLRPIYDCFKLVLKKDTPCKRQLVSRFQNVLNYFRRQKFRYHLVKRKIRSIFRIVKRIVSEVLKCKLCLELAKGICQNGG